MNKHFSCIAFHRLCLWFYSQFVNVADTAIVGFSSASCCAYAKEALHGFEYPPGCPLDIEYYDGNGYVNAFYLFWILLKIFWNANLLLSTLNASYKFLLCFTFSMDESGYGSYNNGAAGGVYAGSQSYSQTQMYGQQTAGRSSYQPPSPPSGTTVLSNSETKKRLFIVSYPERVSTRVLSDMFSRFGNFISVSYIPGNFLKFIFQSILVLLFMVCVQVPNTCLVKYIELSVSFRCDVLMWSLNWLLFPLQARIMALQNLQVLKVQTMHKSTCTEKIFLVITWNVLKLKTLPLKARKPRINTGIQLTLVFQWLLVCVVASVIHSC